MAHVVDFNTVSTVGLESSPVAAALAGLRAHEARYFKNKYDHTFTVEPASSVREAIDWVDRILEEERDIVIELARWRPRPSSWEMSGSPTSSTRAACRST